MSFDLEFVELTADVLDFFFIEQETGERKEPVNRSNSRGGWRRSFSEHKIKIIHTSIHTPQKLQVNNKEKRKEYKYLVDTMAA